MFTARQFFTAIVLILLPLSAAAQQDEVVASVGDYDITLGEYEGMFLKTSTGVEAARQSGMEERQKFLDLLINFRLKLMDAYAAGLERNPDVRQEMELYKGSLATSYLIDREVTKPGIRRLYDERQTEYRASHILLPFSPEDSAGSYAKANELLSRLKKGEDFGRLAVNASSDPSVKDNRGDLYYFSAGQMVRPFEEAVAGMKPGEILPYPVRTRFGLHLIKLVDKQPSSGEIRCSHIMTRFTGPDPTPEDTLRAYNDLKAVQDSLNAGADFADMARRYSQDPGSSPSGGDLGWFSRRRWVPEFDEQAFKLSPGQTSGIIRSRYGYHLIRCTDRRPPKSFEESESEIRKLYEQTRFNDDKERYLDRLRKETGFHLDEAVLSQFISELDTMRSMKYVGWADSLSRQTLNSTLMTFGDHAVTVDSTVRLLKSRSDLNSTLLRPAAFREAVDKIAEQAMFQVRAASLEEEDPQFARLMQEYRDGILLYQIEQERVWNNIAVTDSSLQAFHAAHRDDFRYPDRVRYVEIRTVSDSIARSIPTRVAAGMTFAEIAAEDNARMARPVHYDITFSPQSVRFSQETLDKMKAVAEDLRNDPSLRVHIIAHPDTVDSPQAPEAMDLATRRAERLKKQLSFRLKIAEERIATFVRPSRRTTAAAERAKQSDVVDIDIVGRRDRIIGSVDTLFVPVEEDDRSRAASKLEPGAVSAPVRYKNGYSVVRLLTKEPARVKTFEEAGTEVSSAFQEHESNRLEREWLDQLRQRYPVVRHEEVLEKAFAE